MDVCLVSSSRSKKKCVLDEKSVFSLVFYFSGPLQERGILGCNAPSANTDGVKKREKYVAPATKKNIDKYSLVVAVEVSRTEEKGGENSGERGHWGTVGQKNNSNQERHDKINHAAD